MLPFTSFAYKTDIHPKMINFSAQIMATKLLPILGHFGYHLPF